MRLAAGCRWSASSTLRVWASQRWMLIQATKVRRSEDRGQWMGRFSYMPRWTSLKNLSRSQVRRSDFGSTAAPCSAQAACRGSAAGWPRPSWRSLASRVPSKEQDACGEGGWGRGGCGVEGALAVARSTGAVSGGWVENSLTLRAEAAEGHPQGEAQVIGGGLGVVFWLVGRQGGALGAVDGGLCPGLGVAPRGGAGAFEFDGGLAVGFVNVQKLASITAVTSEQPTEKTIGSRLMSP